MRRSGSLQKMVATIVAVAFCYLSVIVAPVHATLISTGDILQIQENRLARQKVQVFLERQDVGDYLKAMGVDAKEAQARVDTMTDEEVRMLVNKIDQMPAGGDALGFVVAVAIVVFVVLIITDITGVTDVFTFIKKR